MKINKNLELNKSTDIVKNNQKGIEKNSEFKILTLLSQPKIVQENLKEIFIKLENIYKDNPRHSYSLISKIISDMNTDFPESSAFIVHSCEYFIKTSKSSLKDDFDEENINNLCSKIAKIEDHVRLEEFRSDKENVLIEKINTAQKDFDQKKSEWNKSKKKIDKSVNKLKKSELNIITSLGILISLVLTMTGILSILGSSLQNIANVSILKLILTLLIIVLIIIIFIFGMKNDENFLASGIDEYLKTK